MRGNTLRSLDWRPGRPQWGWQDSPCYARPALEILAIRVAPADISSDAFPKQRANLPWKDADRKAATDLRFIVGFFVPPRFRDSAIYGDFDVGLRQPGWGHPRLCHIDPRCLRRYRSCLAVHCPTVTAAISRFCPANLTSDRCPFELDFVVCSAIDIVTYGPGPLARPGVGLGAAPSRRDGRRSPCGEIVSLLFC